ncbi:MAG TPA: PQQ-binding-like beta-propeller repeat protein [Bryobacteraceae bacterium]|nr:PQQ-binding-like beta-propeller repeat protein [Bryobacteraceae bacterium]
MTRQQYAQAKLPAPPWKVGQPFSLPNFCLRLLAIALSCTTALASDWLTDGKDSQRTNWQKDEKVFTLSNIKDTKLLWKVKLDNQTRQMHSLFVPLIVEKVKTRSGPKEILIETGVSDNIYAIEAETGKVIWKKHFSSSYTPPPRRGDILCPGGITATPVVGPTSTPGKYTLYAASWDGSLHQLNVADGEDVVAPMKFMPPNGKPYALNLFKGALYTHTAQGCGGNPNMVYVFDLATGKVGSWGPAGGGMWGRQGPAIASDGTMYTGTGDGNFNPEIGSFGNGIIGIKQNPQSKAAELVDYFGPSNAAWLWKRDLDMQVTPVIFPFEGKELMADAGKECRVYLMDTASIGGDDHRTPAYRTPLLCNEDVNFASAGIWGSMASWQDAKGTRWVLTPFWGPKHSAFKAPVEYGEVEHGAIAAFKVEDRNGKYELAPAWVSRDMNRAEPPVIANGIVFSYGSGEDTDQAFPDVGLDDSIEHRIPGSTHATLYAFDAETGRELWSSGDQITTWNHWSGISVANGRVYIGTFDGTLYCFGVKK